MWKKLCGFFSRHPKETANSCETLDVNSEIKDFLEKNAFVDKNERKMLSNYFGKDSTEKRIVRNSTGVQVVVDNNYRRKKRYVLIIVMPNKEVLRNCSQVESSLLTAIRELVRQEKPHWNVYVLSKVEICDNTELTKCRKQSNPSTNQGENK